MTRVNRGNSLLTIFDLPEDEAGLRSVIDDHAERILVWVGPRATGCNVDINQFDARKLIHGGCDRACMIARAEYDELERVLYITPPTGETP